MFIDKVHVLVQAGNGGDGCESYYYRTDKKVIPHGGDGGNGGHVIFRAQAKAPGLASFRARQHIVGESGAHGGSERKRGKNGEHLIVPVPLGTRITDRNRNFLIREFQTEGEEVIVVEGGHGGSGNQGGKEATKGTPGGILDLELSVKLFAEVFLVGLPNSGKSTLLNKLTGSRVKEESYPFSTRVPELGVLPVGVDERVTICELPSVYNASHEGRGVGADFLKHLDGAKLILFVVDPVSQFAGSLKEGLEILQDQVKRHNEKFAQIPFAVAVTKMDLPEAIAAVKSQRFKSKNPIFNISNVTGEGLPELKNYLKKFSIGF